MKRKILFFVGAMESGGAERVASSLVNQWVKDGHDVSLVLTHLSSFSCFYPISDKVKVVFMGEKVKKNGMCKFLQLRKIMKDSDADYTFSFLVNVNVNVLLASLGLGRKVTVSERVDIAHEVETSFFMKTLRRILYRFAYCVIVQTEGNKRS